MNKSIAAVGIAAVLFAAVGLSEARQMLPQSVAKGPSGAELYRANQAFSVKLGSKHAVGYFAAERGACALTVMLAENVDPDSQDRMSSAARIRTMLAPQDKTEVESEEAFATITCGATAETVAVSMHTKGPGRQSGL
ncbi:hypothetical protein [Prosthecomicrobium hirschii]|uniref:hypothetical protein n=1 Tax=Prosthecodimorpha hirschii TaxID=665126 RepID=UPI002220D5C8|nr:hypothetical protein [Prosthecomicrobium hirschii]MCW1839646.1 hypothetical protein [Prosthecomicrobium hirschii]